MVRTCTPSPQSSEAFSVESCSSAAFSVAVAETKGKRASLEDAHSMVCTERWGDFWLLDGHRGSEAANFGARALPKEFGQTIQGGRLPSNSRIQQGFRTVDNRLRKHCKETESKAGSTVVGALVALDGDGTYTAKLINCGDSRGIIIKDPADEDPGRQPCVLETVDHKPNSPSEKARIKAAGGSVCGGRIPRVDGRLAVSRSIGDFEFKADKGRQASDQKVSCEPDVYEVSGLRPGSLLLLACDGVWDVLSSKTVAKKVRDQFKANPGADLRDVASLIARQSLERGSTDNLTVLIVRLGGVASTRAADDAPREAMASEEEAGGCPTS
mmetsp:Transcript_101733/g.273274  ORF Transcript_101733/g.273274 Transcript_101733/m.273274 type:complete len:327 (-) Transcript_101733:86-1066(-)